MGCAPATNGPPAETHALCPLLQFVVCTAPRNFVRFPPRRARLVEDQRRDSVRMQCRERHRDEAAVACGEDGRPLGPCRIEHRAKVVHQRLDRRDIRRGETLGASQASSVGHDQAGKARQLAQKAGARRVLPVQDDIRHIALEVGEVDRAFSDQLVGERVLAVPRIADLRLFHPHIVAQHAHRRQRFGQVVGAATRPAEWSVPGSNRRPPACKAESGLSERSRLFSAACANPFPHAGFRAADRAYSGNTPKGVCDRFLSRALAAATSVALVRGHRTPRSEWCHRRALSFVTLTTNVRLDVPTLPTTRQQPTVGKVSPVGWKP